MNNSLKFFLTKILLLSSIVLTFLIFHTLQRYRVAVEDLKWEVEELDPTPDFIYINGRSDFKNHHSLDIYPERRFPG